MPSGNKPKPYEQQEGETAKAFEAFRVYRDLAPSDRSVQLAAKKLAKTPRTLSKWSTANHWARRASTWDGERDRRARQAELRAIDEMKRRHIRNAQLAQERGRLKLKSSVSKAKKAKGAFDDLSEADAFKLVEGGAKLERVTMGEAGEVVETREPDNAPDLSKLKPTELAELARLQKKMRGGS